MGKSNFAVFVDLENAGGKESMLLSIIEKVKIRGDILLGKVYGYTDRYSDLKACLLSNTFSVVPSLRYGKNQKNNLDIQLVIDAMVPGCLCAEKYIHAQEQRQHIRQCVPGADECNASCISEQHGAYFCAGTEYLL